jgi:hypothetical protein
MIVRIVGPAAIRRLDNDGQGARRTGQGHYSWPVPSEGMEAIHDMKTMAGSPDAEAVIALQSASRNLAHGFCVLGFHEFRKPMKDISDV